MGESSLYKGNMSEATLARAKAVRQHDDGIITFFFLFQRRHNLITRHSIKRLTSHSSFFFIYVENVKFKGKCMDGKRLRLSNFTLFINGDFDRCERDFTFTSFKKLFRF